MNIIESIIAVFVFLFAADHFRGDGQIEFRHDHNLKDFESFRNSVQSVNSSEAWIFNVSYKAFYGRNLRTAFYGFQFLLSSHPQSKPLQFNVELIKWLLSSNN